MFNRTVDAKDYLRLFVDVHGDVHYSGSDMRARNSHDKPEVFNRHYRTMMNDHKYVQVVGVNANAGLIVSRNENSTPMLIGRPSILRRIDSPVPDPEDVLNVMAMRFSDADFLGTWNRFTENDYCTWSIVNELMLSPANDRTRRTLKYHPAWPALSFVTTLDVDSACRLISEIKDPRWFAHHSHPNRMSKLFNYFCLDEGSVEADYTSARTKLSRASLVLNTFMQNKDVPGSFSEVNDPGCFLYRTAAIDRSVTSACRRLMRFIVLVWRSAVSTHPEMKFVPEMFFGTDGEVRAWKRHVTEIDGV